MSVPADQGDRSEWIREVAMEVAAGILSQGFEPTPVLRRLLGVRLPPDVSGGRAVSAERPPSREQFEIVAGASPSARSSRSGGGIREYASSASGRCSIRYPVQEMCRRRPRHAADPLAQPAARRAVSFEGQDYQLPLTEPEAGNAIHGLLRWRNWRALERRPRSVVMEHGFIRCRAGRSPRRGHRLLGE